jgi:hypothetical protein
VKRPLPALRLRLSRIEHKPKPVFAAGWHDFANVKNKPGLQDELLAIIDSIERGHGVPDRHYRAGIDRDRDGLLEETGIMHLHLGGKDSDVLLFLIQYEDRVVLLETNTHMHFRTEPAGKNIAALTQSWLAHLEHDVAECAEKARTTADAVERAAAEDRREKIAASIAAFKARMKSPSS